MKKNITWRMLGLLMTVAGIVFNYIMASGNRLSIITDQYNSLFVPAGYAFMIWSCIYVSVIIYSVYSLSRRQLSVIFHNGLAKLVTLLAAGGMAWIWAYTSGQMGLSVLFIVLMLGTGLLALKTAHLGITEKNETKWLTVPFGLYAAWLCVATISNISLLLKSKGWLQGVFNEEVWAIIMLIVAAALAMITAARFRTITFPLVTAWATVAIWIRQRGVVESVEYAALAASILLLCFMVMYFKTIYSTRSTIHTSRKNIF